MKRFVNTLFYDFTLILLYEKLNDVIRTQKSNYIKDLQLYITDLFLTLSLQQDTVLTLSLYEKI